MTWSLVFEFSCSGRVNPNPCEVNAKTLVASQDFATSCWGACILFYWHLSMRCCMQTCFLSWFYNHSVCCLKNKANKNHFTKQTPENRFSSYVHFDTNQWSLISQEANPVSSHSRVNDRWYWRVHQRKTWAKFGIRQILTWKAFRMTDIRCIMWCTLGLSWVDLLQASQCLFQKIFSEELPIFFFTSLVACFNCLSVVHSNFRLIVYNLMTMCCVYQMQIVQSLQEAFHLNESACGRKEMWFENRGQFWQLMTWCKWTGMSCWLFFFSLA